MNKLYQEAIGLLEKANDIGLITHTDGDGDAFGSTLAMARVLNQMGKKVLVFSNEKFSPEIEVMSEGSMPELVDTYKKVDLLICLDFNNIKRAVIPEILNQAKAENIPILVIDHHLRGEIGEIANLYLNKPVSSTCELVFGLIKAWNYRIDAKTANFLLFGLETDTSSLSNAGTSEESYKVAAELLSLGAKIKPIIEALRTRTLPSAKLIGRVLKRLHLNKNYNLAATYVTQKDIKDLSLDEATVSSGLANYLDQVKEAENIIVFTETKEGEIKVSMRSNRSGANVGKLAEFLGGGGHRLASGFIFRGSIKEITK